MLPIFITFNLSGKNGQDIWYILGPLIGALLLLWFKPNYLIPIIFLLIIVLISVLILEISNYYPKSGENSGDGSGENTTTINARGYERNRAEEEEEEEYGL